MTAADLRAKCHEAIDRMGRARLDRLALHMGVIEPPRLTQHEPPQTTDDLDPWGMA